MSIGGKKDGNNWFDLIATLCIGISIIAFGLSVTAERLYFSYIHGFTDLGKYHSIVGIGTIGLGVLYLALAFKNYLAKS